MDLFPRRDNQTPPPPDMADLEQYYADRQPSLMRRLLVPAATILGVVIIGLLVFMAARWTYNKVAHRNDSDNTKKTSLQTTPQTKSTTSQKSSGSTTARPGSDTQATTTQTTTPPPATPPSQTLPKTGDD